MSDRRVSKEELEAFWRGDKNTYQRMYSDRMQQKANAAEKQGKQVTYIPNDGSVTLPEVSVTAPRETEEQKQARLKQDYENLVDNTITVAGFVPGADTFADITDIGNSWRKGDYSGMLWGLAGLGLPVSGKTLKSGWNYLQGAIMSRVMNNSLDIGKIYKNIPIDKNRSYRQVGPSAIIDAEKTGIIRANPNSRVQKQQKRWAGASFQQGNLYNPYDKESTHVIVSNNPNTEFVKKEVHQEIEDFDLTTQRNKNIIGEEVTPIYNEKLNNAPVNDFFMFERINSPNGKISWRKTLFKPESKPNIISYTPSPPQKSASIDFSFKILQDAEDIKSLKEFAKQYGYTLPKGIERYSGEMLDKEFKRILTKHNTFGRGVQANNIQDAEKFLTTAHSGSAGAMDGMPSGKTGIYTMNGLSPYGNYQDVVQRSLDFSGPRSTWITKNDTPYLSSDDASKQLTLLKEQYMQRNPYQGQEDYFDNMWKYLENNNPEVFNSSGQIYKINDTDILKQVGVPGVVIHGGNPGEKVLNARRIFKPYNLGIGQTSTRGFSHKAYQKGGKL